MKWLQRPENKVIVAIGKAISVPCQAEGSPHPKVYWRRLDRDEHRDDTHSQSELRFNSATMQDSGIYECIASNGIDEDLTTRIQLDVRGK